MERFAAALLTFQLLSAGAPAFASQDSKFFSTAGTSTVGTARAGIMSERAPAQVKDGRFELKELFDQSDIVIIGWHHVPANDFVPRALTKALEDEKLRGAKIAIALEHEPGKPPKAYATGGPEYMDMIATAFDLGIDIYPADLSSQDAGINRSEYSKEDVIALRDKNFADVLSWIVKDKRQKPVLLVGGEHVPGIQKALQGKGFKNVAALLTTYDFDTGEVKLGAQVIGRSKTDPMLQAQEQEKRLIDELSNQWRALDPAAKSGNEKAKAQQSALMDRIEESHANFKLAFKIYDKRLQEDGRRWAKEFENRLRRPVRACIDVFRAK